MPKLTPKQKRFCEEYVTCLDGQEAAIKAGYSEKTAAIIASQNLIKLNITEYLQELNNKRQTRTLIDQDYVLRHLAQLIRVSSQLVYKEHTDQQGEPKLVESILDPSALRGAIELAGRHNAMWTDKKIIDVNDISKDQENKILSEISRLRDQRQQVLQ